MRKDNETTSQKHSSRLSLFPQHLEDLRRSGLSDDTIIEAGIKSVPPNRIDKRLKFSIPGLISMYEVPYPGNNGYCRYKAFYEEGHGQYKDGRKKPKYLTRKNAGNRLYMPPKVRPVLSDFSIYLYFTEGEKKSLKACQEGLYCIGIPGLWNWKVKDEHELIPDFDQIVLDGRIVHLVPDNDWLKPDRKGEQKNLKQAVCELAYLLIDRGANVCWVELPGGGA